MTWQMLCEQSWSFSPKPGMSSPERRKEQSLVNTHTLDIIIKCQHVAGSGCLYKQGTCFPRIGGCLFPPLLHICILLHISMYDAFHPHEPQRLKRPMPRIVSSSTYCNAYVHEKFDPDLCLATMSLLSSLPCRQGGGDTDSLKSSDFANIMVAYLQQTGVIPSSQSSYDRKNKHVKVAAGSKRRGGTFAGAKKRQRTLPKSAKRKRDADSTTG